MAQHDLGIVVSFEVTRTLIKNQTGTFPGPTIDRRLLAAGSNPRESPELCVVVNQRLHGAFHLERFDFQ
jgi:hypothetical protein